MELDDIEDLHTVGLELDAGRSPKPVEVGLIRCAQERCVTVLHCIFHNTLVMDGLDSQVLVAGASRRNDVQDAAAAAVPGSGQRIWVRTFGCSHNRQGAESARHW